MKVKLYRNLHILTFDYIWWGLVNALIVTIF